MKETKWTTKRIFAVALIIYVITAMFSLGYHHRDEHFQIMEFASCKLGLGFDNDLPWEYHFQMRPALQPAMVVALYSFLELFGVNNPFFIAFLLRLVSALLSLYAIKLIIDLYYDHFEHPKTRFWFLIFSFFIWFSLYNNVRFSSENWSGNLFIIGFALMMKAVKPVKLWTYLLVGGLFGLAFVIRYQAAFLVLGFGIWLLIQRKDPFGKLVLMAMAFFAMFGLGVLIDRWYYGNWVLTTWNYLKWNILADRVSTFGIEPWYYYITKTILDTIPPFSLLYVAGFFWMIFKRPKSAITWTILPFLAIHFLIGHKETRFMFPLVGFMPVGMAFVVDWTLDKYGSDFYASNTLAKWFKRLFWVTNVVLLVIVMFRPANNTMWRHFRMYNIIHKPAIMYFEDTSPFGESLPYRFYMRPDLETMPYDVVDTLLPEPNRQVFFGTTDQKMVERYKDSATLVYQTYPEWIKKFNFNGWADRTTFYFIMELNNPDEQ